MALQNSITSFVNTTSSPAYQNWYSPTPTEFTFIQSNPVFPPSVNLPILIRDVLNTSQASIYSEFRLVAKKEYFLNNGQSIDWIKIFSSAFLNDLSNAEQYYPITSLGLELVFTLEPQNFILTSAVRYGAKIMLSIQGNNNGLWTELYNYEHIIFLYVFATQTVSYTPTTFVLNHYQLATPVVQKKIILDGPNWEVLAPYNFILESADPSVVITTTTLSGIGTRYKAVGSSLKEIIIKPSAYFNTPEALATPTSNKSITISNPLDSSLIGILHFAFNIFTLGDFTISPTSLTFEASKGHEEPLAINVSVAAPSAYTITHPFWVSVTPSEEVTTGNFNNLTIVPISHTNLSEGEYSGKIILTSIVLGATIVVEIPIFYTLYDFIASPYVGKLYNFTKDSLFLDFYTQINNTYFDVLMKVKIFDLYFQTALFQEYIIPFKVPLFNRKQRENIGLRIDKMITKLSTPILNSSNIYNAAQVVIEVSEKTYPERIEIRKTTLSPINFLAGTTPKNKVNNCAFLEMSNGTKRIANASFDFINLMLQPGVIYICQILSNETVIKEFEIISETTTYLYKLNFNEIDYNPGDVIEFKIGKQEVTEIQFISKKYLIFPEAEFSNIILFEDDYKLIQSYEFTGIHLIKSEFTFQNTNIKRNLIDYIKNIDSKDVPKLTINTGFIPKSDIEIISSLINASRVWLYVSENNLIEMVNETKSIIFDDADRELNSFELEFTINKKRYEENYSF